MSGMPIRYSNEPYRDRQFPPADQPDSYIHEFEQREEQYNYQI